MRPQAAILALLTVFLACARRPRDVLEGGVRQLERGEFARATASFRAVVKDAPQLRTADADQRSAIGLLALAYAHGGEPEKARAAAARAVAADPLDYVALAALGIADLGAGDLPAAERNIRKSIAARQGAWQQYSWLAAVLLARDDIRGARAVLEESVDLNPEDGVSRSWLVVTDALVGDREAALRELRAIVLLMNVLDHVALFREDPQVGALYAFFQSLFRGDVEGAISGLAPREAELEPVGAAFFLGVAELVAGRRAAAVGHLERQAGRGARGSLFQAPNPFGCLSQMWLAALYAAGGDLQSFLTMQRSWPQCIARA